MNPPEKVIKYYKKYSAGNWKVFFPFEEQYEAVIVVPAIDEFENLQKMISSLNKNSSSNFDKILLLIVVNNTLNAPHEIKHENKRTIDWLKESRNTGLNFSLNFIDASSEGNELPDKNGGVGFARKLGMDSALQFFDYASHRKRIIVCLDADCVVSENYIDEIINNFNDKGLYAAYVNYHHLPGADDEKNFAIICYEIFLRYYVLGLRYAGSPYAIHTIGSTMICTDEAYIKAEGMNKRKAAEDFYFMEKLAKSYDIFEIKNAAVYPSGRPSWRVPFGTGQRVNRYLSRTQDEYIVYSPDSFEILKKWLMIFNENISASDYLNRAQNLDPALYNFLVEQKFEKDIAKIISHSRNELQLDRQKKNWFDGFKTLKLIHYLRDNGYPNQDMFSALDEMLFKFNLSMEMRAKEKIPPLEIQKNYLELLRKIA